MRGSYLDNDYSVWIKREPPPRGQELEAGVQSAWALVQGLGGLIITVLTIQKLWEGAGGPAAALDDGSTPNRAHRCGAIRHAAPRGDSTGEGALAFAVAQGVTCTTITFVAATVNPHAAANAAVFM